MCKRGSMSLIIGKFTLNKTLIHTHFLTGGPTFIPALFSLGLFSSQWTDAVCSLPPPDVWSFAEPFIDLEPSRNGSAASFCFLSDSPLAICLLSLDGSSKAWNRVELLGKEKSGRWLCPLERKSEHIFGIDINVRKTIVCDTVCDTAFANSSINKK